jgi:hypothetical protein
MQEISLITSRLESIGIPYCLVGGIAAIAYGRPRLTLDADMVIALRAHQVQLLMEAFPEEDFYLPPQEVLLTEIQRPSHGHFNIIHQHSALRADCYLPGASELARWELANRIKLQGAFGEAWFAPPEAIIINKLIFYREGGSTKHLDDIRGMLDAQAVPEKSEMLRWIEELNLKKEWQAVLEPK